MFKKRITPIQNIAYLGLMAAINIIFVLLTTVLPPLMFLLIFILPLASAIVTVFCKKIYFPIYFVVTVGLCLVTSFYDTFFYIIPSLITGFIFGIFIEKKVPGIHIITSATFFQYGLTYLTFIIVNSLVTGRDFFDTLLNMFGLQNFQYKLIFEHVFYFLLSGIQILITYIIIKVEIKKLGLQINLFDNKHYIGYIICSLSLIFATIAYFCYPPLVYIFIFVSIYYFVYFIAQLLLEKRSWIYITIGVVVFASIFLFAFLYKYPVKPLSIILLIIPIFSINIISFVNNRLTKNQN